MVFAFNNKLMWRMIKMRNKLLMRQPGILIMILNPTQVYAVYRALCALNSVPSTEFTTKFDGGISVAASGMVHIKRARPAPFEGSEHEHYFNQAAFFAAYNLS